MTDHIYGRRTLELDPERPFFFIKELDLYIEYLKTHVLHPDNQSQKNFDAQLTKFKVQMESGIQYYRTLIADPVFIAFGFSKKAAEDHLLSHHHPMEMIIVHPTFMLGAYDTKPGSGKIILMARKKKVIFYPPGGKNFVHVEDVANGILQCIETGRNGEKYLLAHENLSYRQFFKKLNALANQKPLMIKLPRIVLLGIGHFGNLLRTLGIQSNLSLVNMKILSTTNYYSNQKSISQLGMRYRPVDEAIADALEYFKQ